MTKNNIKVIILAVVLLAISAIVFYLYFSSHVFQLIRQAENLYAQGELHEAHDKAEEAMMEDPFNRRAIALKSQLFFEITNLTELTDGVQALKDADAAVQNSNYIEASNLYHEAYGHFFNVSSMAKQYNEAQNLMKQSMTKEKDINNNIAEQYYNNAMRMYRNGEFSQAFEYLQQSPAESPDIIRLKSDIGYTIGLRRYEDISKNPTHFPLTYKNDAIYWLKQVNVSDKNYDHARRLIQELDQMPAAQQ